MPQGGKHAVNPRLVEDARRPHQKPTKLARTKTNAMDADYIAGIWRLFVCFMICSSIMCWIMFYGSWNIPIYVFSGSAPFVMRDIHSRSAQHGFNRGKHVFKYWMRKNPNEARRNPKNWFACPCIESKNVRLCTCHKKVHVLYFKSYCL